MSRTIRRPPPRRRLRAGYVKRLCWRCRGRVYDCSCPARDLVVERAELTAIETDIARVFEPPPLEDCECEWCVRELQEIASDWHWSKYNEDWWPFVKDAERQLTQPLSAVMPGWHARCDCYSCDSTGDRY